MTNAMIRWSCLMTLCLVLTGCSLAVLNPSVAEETELFARGLDQYTASGDLTTLKEVPQRYPAGEWRSRAETVIALAEQQRAAQARRDKAEKELAQCQQELSRGTQEKDDLARDNQMLEVTLERLKQVLIDMELKAK